MRLRLICVLGLGCTVQACAVVVDDLRLDSVQRTTDPAVLREMPGPGAKEVLKVTLSTTKEFWGSMKRYGMQLSLDAYPCGSRNTNDQLKDGGVMEVIPGPYDIEGPYFNGISLNWSSWADYSQQVPKLKESGRFSIDLYLGIFRETPSRPEWPRYDFRRHPEDVCFVIVGGSMAPISFSSNEVKIPRQMISSALRNGA